MIKNEATQNPLASLFRQPKIYIELPSKGQFYQEGTLETSESGEHAVYAMTARDELLFKTPDALMNGTSTVEVIKSCIPSIKNPWAMPSIDVDAVLCAIRIATYGHEMDVTSKCPNCEHINDFAIDLRQALDNLRNINFETNVVINDTILVKVRPLTYDEMTKTSLKVFEHQRVFSILNDSTLSDEEKVKMFQESFVKLTDLTFKTVSQCIVSVETVGGKTDNPEYIEEFLRNTDKSVFSELNKSIEKSKKTSIMPAIDAECAECHHKYQMELTLDQSDFFGKGF